MFLVVCAVLSIVLLALVHRKEKVILANSHAKRDAARAAKLEAATEDIGTPPSNL